VSHPEFVNKGTRLGKFIEECGKLWPNDGAANYYADNCVRCGKTLKMQSNGDHEDEWHRGHCKECYVILAANCSSE